MTLAAIVPCMMFVFALPFAIVWLHKKIWWVGPKSYVSAEARLKKELRRSFFMATLYSGLNALAIIALIDWSSAFVNACYIIQVVCWSICLYCEIKHYQYVQWEIKTQKTQPAP